MHRPAMPLDPAKLEAELLATRQLTLDLVRLATGEELRTAYHPDFSPIGWHLGHIAAFEAFWVLGDERPIRPQWQSLFDPRLNAKPERTRLPPADELLAFADEVRERTLQRLGEAGEHFFHGLVLAHEQQHAETIATVLRMRPRERREAARGFVLDAAGRAPERKLLHLEASRVCIGEDDRLVGYDNERPAHTVELAAYGIDSRPVTNGEWLVFVETGGYQRREVWTDAGWAWRVAEGAEHPFYWRREGRGYVLQTMGGDIALPLECPVEGISAHEADAYARSAGRRLPTEAEWEHAARTYATASPRLGIRCGGPRPGGDFIGNTWEWTSSVFAGYPGFEPFPYEGYSRPYFDGLHRVLRGGSWATQARIARPSFRNWYPPHWRAMPAGVRLAGTPHSAIM